MKESQKQTLLPVVLELPADLETPVSAFMKLQPLGARFLLESVELGQHIGRYSFIGIGFWKELQFPLDTHTDPLEMIEEELSKFEVAQDPRIPKLLGGAVGHIGYPYVQHVEASVEQDHPDPLGLPLAHFFLVDTLVLFDHVHQTIYIAALDGVPDRPPASRRVADIQDAMAYTGHPTPNVGDSDPGPFQSDVGKEAFLERVHVAKEYIAEGDLFQLVLSHRCSGPIGSIDPFTIYRSLRRNNPSPYMFFFDFDHYHIVGSSPEMLVRLEGNRAELRPIAGTRPRNVDPKRDQKLEMDLLSDPKERAEHLMLVDLARNDLGRVCHAGTIEVAPYFSVERYSHVMHIVSGVRGDLLPECSAFDLFRATFPAGTVSGAPKVRAMKRIEELESSSRGPYAGAIGYFGLTGEMDMCIAIRSIILKRGNAHLQAGAGIVYDSDPEREWEETHDKMEGLAAAIRLAHQMGS
ncbi:MAG: anthranilate synthase component I family protein [Planctomycetota bacterium]|jgi:anthranilate synthase component 1|nr:anthranilate synthase component I family protein [Planctomycetota bacterium]